MKRALAGAVAGAAALLLVGCGEETTGGGSAILFGRVVDLEGAGVFDAEVSVIYLEQRTAGAAVAAVGPRMLPPFPNPSEGRDFDTVRVPLRVEADTLLTVAVWSPIFGVPVELRRLVDRRVSRDTTLAWDLTDRFGSPLPNGIYEMRLFDGATGELLATEPVLLNRFAPLIDRREEVNVFTDPDGDFQISPVFVGEAFTATGENGTVLGRAVLRPRVILLVRHPDYQELSLEVIIGPGERVEVDDLSLPRLSRSRQP